MSENAEFPEIEALRQAKDFPAPDPERDRRVKEAMRAKLGRRGGPKWKRSLGWVGVSLAAMMVVGVTVAFLYPGPNQAPEVVSYYFQDATIGGYEGAPVAKWTGDLPFDAAGTQESEAESVFSLTAGLKSTGAGGGGHWLAESLSENDRLADYSVNTARWGPPSSPGRLRVLQPSQEPPSAGPQPPAASLSWRPSSLTPNATRLMVGDREELPLKGLQVEARIDGFRARVLLDLYFLNDRGQQLEGNFQLRLPPGASPYYLSFGQTVLEAEKAPVNTLFTSFEDPKASDLEPAVIAGLRRATSRQLTEARMVPREKAAFAYRETVRRVVDPALLEWSGAGIFSARVFPLAPGLVHRITLGYDLDLARSGADLEWRFDLPAGVPSARIDLDAAELPGALGLEPAAEPVRAGGRARFHLENPPAPSVTLRLKGAGPLLLAGSDRTGPYFAASFRPELPAATAEGGSSHAVFLVDTSLSSNPERLGLWLKLLRGILDSNRDALRSFAVLFFNVESSWWQEKFVENNPENVAALLAFAEGLALEGATDLRSALAEGRAPRWLDREAQPKSWDSFLLSDGSATWGERDSRAIAARLRKDPRGPLFAYSTGLQGTDVALLGELARETGGSVFSVVGEGELAKASRAHRLRPWSIAGIELEGGSDLLLAGRPRAIYFGQDLFLVGRGSPRAGAEVKLRLRRGEEERAFSVKLDPAIASDLAPRAYGQVAVGQLEELREATTDFSRGYANHFRVTGLSSSLLLLEREEDYARYKIVPEEDALLVSMRPVSAILETALRAAGGALSDPRGAFLAWLKGLEGAGCGQVKIQAALRLALEGLPPAAFEVDPAPLAVKARAWKSLPGAFQEMLVSRKLDYDAVAAEAERRLRELGPSDALKALSSLLEESPGDGVLTRDVAFSAIEWGFGGHAYHLLKPLAAARPCEAPLYQALAAGLDEARRPDLALAFYEAALSGNWDPRFGELRTILVFEYLDFLRRAAGGEKFDLADYARARIETLEKEQGLARADLVVTILWSTDGTDVDLHVTEPTGEECYYRHAQTRIGGRLTRDVTQGYGPERYVLRDAVPGEYRITAHYFASDRNRASARTRVLATVIRGAGTPEARIERRAVALASSRDSHDLLTVKVGK